MAYYVLVKKLEFLRSELVSHVPSDWRKWPFKDLLEALPKWTDTNTTSSKRSALSDRVFFSEDRHVNNSSIASIVIAQNTLRRTVARFLPPRNERLS